MMNSDARKRLAEATPADAGSTPDDREPCVGHYFTFTPDGLAEHDRQTAAPIEAERDDLRRWKGEALEVIGGLQELGRALNLPLGERITGPRAVAAVNDLRARLAAVERVLDNAEPTYHVNEYGDEISSHSEYVAADDLREALATDAHDVRDDLQREFGGGS